MTGGPLLRFEGVSKTYRGTGASELTVLQDIALEVEPGSSISLIGPNGAGKSTLLRVAAGVSVPSLGRVTRPARTTVVLELGPAFDPELTGRENLELGLALHGIGGRRRRAVTDEIVEFADIGSALTEPVKHYSTGMRARLGLSIALHSDPELLLIDEVLTVGDFEFQRAVLQRTSKMVSQGVAMILVTHDPQVAVLAARRGLWIDGGRIAADGRVVEVVTAYVRSVSGVRIPSEWTHTKIRSVDLVPDRLAAGEPAVLHAEVLREAGAQGASFVLELLPPVGDRWWMREPDQSPSLRAVNVVASSAPWSISAGSMNEGLNHLRIAIDRLPRTPPGGELVLVAFDDSGAVMSECPCAVEFTGTPSDRPVEFDVTVKET